MNGIESVQLNGLCHLSRNYKLKIYPKIHRIKLNFFWDYFTNGAMEIFN